MSQVSTMNRNGQSTARSTWPLAVRERDLPWENLRLRPGYNERYIGAFDQSRNLALRIGALYNDTNFHGNRHRHTFQQIRYVLRNEFKLGKELCKEGDCIYFPEGVRYGPQDTHMDPSGKAFQFVVLILQFTGPSGIPYPEPDEVLRARRELAEIGTFEDGVYTFPTGRKRDAYEAILEHLTGKPVTYPAGRLTNPVIMRTPEYPWTSHRRLTGIAVKQLGCFFEGGPNIAMMSMERGARVPAGQPLGHRAIVLLDGAVQFQGETFDTLSFFVIPSGVTHTEIAAASPAELLVVGWTEDKSELPASLF